MFFRFRPGVCRKALLNQCNSFNYFTVPQGSCEHESVSLFPAKWGAAAPRQFSRSVHAARNFSAKVRLPTAEGNGPKLLSHRGQALPRAAALPNSALLDPRGAEFCFFTTEPLISLGPNSRSGAIGDRSVGPLMHTADSRKVQCLTCDTCLVVCEVLGIVGMQHAPFPCTHVPRADLEPVGAQSEGLV